MVGFYTDCLLKRILEDLKNENKELKRILEDLKSENKELKRISEDLKDEMEEIRDTLERKETSLALGQVAWVLEEEIGKAVLPDQRMGKNGTLRAVERWLKKNSSSPKGKAAQRRWDDLKEKLNWNEDHIYALRQLKELNDDAHPENVDLEEARKQLNEGNYVADEDKKICEEIIDMVVTARKLNSSK